MVLVENTPMVPVRPRTGPNGVARCLFASRMGEEYWSRFVSRTGTDVVELSSRFILRTGTDVSQTFHNFQKFEKMVKKIKINNFYSIIRKNMNKISKCLEK